jgi:hypothetical protein
MVRIAPAGRISRPGRIIERPKPVQQQVQSPTPTPQLTEEQFYAQRSAEQTRLINERIQAERNKLESYKQQYEEKLKEKARPRTLESIQNRITRSDETLTALQEVSGKAKTGRYQYADLISYAQAQGQYKLEQDIFRQAQAKVETTPTPTSEGEVVVGGLGYSVAPSLQQKFVSGMEKPDPLRFLGGTPQQYFSSSDIVKPSGAVWEVQPAPTTRETYKRYVSDKGYIKGTLGFLGGTVSSYVWRGQEIAVKKFGGKYDPQFAETVGKGAGVAPYFTPVGPYIFAASGAETFATPSGRERVKEQQKLYEERGWSPQLAATIAWGEPTLELGIGTLGIRADVKKALLKRDIGKSTTSFVAEETQLTPKVSRVKVISKTRVGKKVTTGVSQQDLFKFGDDYSFGITRGYQISPPKVSIKFPSGRITEDYYISQIRGVTFGRGIGPSRVTIPRTPKGAIYAYAPTPTGQGVLGKTFGKVYKEPGFFETFGQVTVGGFKKIRDSSAYFFKGGRPSKLRIYPGKISYVTTTPIKGILYRKPIKPSARKVDFWATPSTQLKPITPSSKLVQESTMAQVSAISESAKLSSLAKIKPITTPVSGATKTLTTQLTRESSIVSQMLKPQKVKDIQKVKTLQVSAKGIKEKQKTVSRSIQELVTSPAQKQSLIPVTLTKMASATVQRQRMLPRQITKQIQKGSGIRFSPLPVFPGMLLPPIPFPFIIPLFTSSSRRRDIIMKRQGWIPQAKTRGGKWITLSNQPMSRNAALSRAARASDNTTSAQFRIKKSKGKVSQVKDNYFGRTKHKYRPYKIRKGILIKLHNQFIEKRGKRIDTPGEKRGLKLAKYIKKRRTKKKSQWLY